MDDLECANCGDPLEEHEVFGWRGDEPLCEFCIIKRRDEEDYAHRRLAEEC